ncbi:MAG: hypothetical protein LBQ27_00730 [Clostridiales bacterium]|jgi:hypothetical protein|nr:hypothetical protein [Clostridiales bacterium]
MEQTETQPKDTAVHGGIKTRPEIINLETEDKKGRVEVSLGKFKSAEALIKAYISLEAEFTKRSQRVRELERIIDNAAKEQEKAEAKNQTQPDTFDKNPEIFEKLCMDERVKNKVITEYLDGLRSIDLPTLIGKGGEFTALPPKKPKSLEEAGKMTRRLLKK